MPAWMRRYLDEKARACVAAFGLLLSVAVLDYITGSELAMSFFYLIPISIAGWYIGQKTAITVALLGAAAFPLTDALAVGPYQEPWTGFWNFFVRAATLTTIALITFRLRAALARERELARQDPLTGISNARWFQELGNWECAKAIRTEQPLSIAYLDMDGFKKINDTLGHSAGDRLLRSVANALNQNTRASDLVARLGGDEFALLMPSTDEAEALATVDRLTEVFSDLTDKMVTFSIGVGTFYGPPTDIDDALCVVDALMYEAKMAGKNRYSHKVLRGLRDPVRDRNEKALALTPS
jgi:diguanylate cyclase (GGDEF)-like protein